MNDEMAEIITVYEAADLVGLRPETLREEIRKGHLKTAGGGQFSTYKLTEAELEKWWREKGGGELFPETGTEPETTDRSESD